MELALRKLRADANTDVGINAISSAIWQVRDRFSSLPETARRMNIITANPLCASKHSTFNLEIESTVDVRIGK